MGTMTQIHLPEQLVDFMFNNDDPRLIERGTRVVKCDQDTKGDRTPLGTKGTVMGGIFSDEVHKAVDESRLAMLAEKFRKEKTFYLVHFDGDPEMILSAVVGSKIRRL